MTKPTKWHVRPAKTQISLGICPVWSVFAERSMGSWGPTLSSWGQRRLWADWMDALSDLSIRWVHMPFCWFCHEVAQIFENIHYNCDQLTIISNHITTIKSLSSCKQKKKWKIQIFPKKNFGNAFCCWKVKTLFNYLKNILASNDQQMLWKKIYLQTYICNLFTIFKNTI